MFHMSSEKQISDSLCVSGARYRYSNTASNPVRTGVPVGIVGQSEIHPVTADSPKYTDYATNAARLISFSGWISQNVSPNDLSDAGFYYTGIRDYVRCFYCGCGVKDWENGDNAWIEHARWSPNCAYLKQRQGGELLHFSQRLNLDNEEQRQSHEHHASDPLIEDVNSTAAALVISMGYNQTDVENAIRYARNKYGSNELKADYLLEYLLDNGASASTSDWFTHHQRTSTANEHNTSTRTLTPPNNRMDTEESLEQNKDEGHLLQENRQLKDQKLCKICLDQEACMVFVPCGHLVACAQCSRPLTECAVCRAKIREKIRVYAA